MNIQECYDAFGGSYQEVKGRLQSDNLIKRFVTKFLSDTSYERLFTAVKDEDYEEAFRFAHTLKGVCQNLNFRKLSESSSLLTEYLRNKDTSEIDKIRCEELLQQVTEDYQTVVDAVRNLSE